MTDIPKWRVKGELALNCSCELFCPCVVSLGEARPTYGYCQTWIGVRIDSGSWGRVKLGGLNAAMLIDIPGRMGEGNWSMANYIDDNADDKQYEALKAIFTGGARGTTGLFRLLVGTYLGDRRAAVRYETKNEDERHITVPRVITGVVKPIAGANPQKPVVVRNTSYWMGPDVTIAKGLKGKVRDFGRVWNFDEKSAELCAIDWSGP